MFIIGGLLKPVATFLLCMLTDDADEKTRQFLKPFMTSWYEILRNSHTDYKGAR